VGEPELLAEPRRDGVQGRLDAALVILAIDEMSLVLRAESLEYLGVVIGERAAYVEESAALDYVAGYCVVHDVSEREYQLERGGTWDKGKGCETFGPIGPWLVTADEVADPQELDMWLDVNGVRMQTGNTRTMIFTVGKLVSYLSEFMVLEPGDIITTGTPPGVGMGQTPPRFLKAGDSVRLGIQNLGVQGQQVIGPRSPGNAL